ncbi:MAG: hypothetical protein NVSMB3_07760 [Acidobacteriaceae bacterium]
MSEYQYYEFRAIDRPLDQAARGALRAISTRAEITSTSFTNTYNYGDFRGDPAKLMDRYFDAFVYVANWGTHRLMFRIPRRLIDVISIAGGIKTDAGSRVILTRQMKWGALPVTGSKVDGTGGFSTVSLSLDDLLNSATPSENIFIRPGDVVSIPKADLVYVVGDVKKAGGFVLSSHPSVSIIQALSLAEGLDHDASPSRARILRPTPGGDGKPKEIPVDISRILAGQNPDVPLFANDVLFIPNSAVKSGSRRAAEAILQAATGIVVYRR